MITAYHLRVSRSERILWLLEELGLDYRVEAFDRDPSFRAPAALREVHPLGKSPVLRDGDVVIMESGAIVQHLVERHGGGRLAPAPDDPARARYLEWLHWTEGSLAAWLVMDLIANSGLVPGVDPGPLRGMLADEIGRGLDWVESELAGNDFACGREFTAADTMLGWALRFARERGHAGDRKNVAAYLERVTSRDAWRRAMEKAG